MFHKHSYDTNTLRPSDGQWNNLTTLKPIAQGEASGISACEKKKGKNRID